MRRRQYSKRRYLTVEPLEARQLLAASPLGTPDPNWFFEDPNTPGQPVVGPALPLVEDWVVLLSESAARELFLHETKTGSVSIMGHDAQVLRGLGTHGLVQLRTYSLNRGTVEQALAQSSDIESFFPNDEFFATLEPNDSDFGSQIGLNNVGQFGALAGADVDATEAWSVSTGDRNVVSAIIDAGVDLGHPDLYENVWINQGEIPEQIFVEIVDADADGIVSFVDLNFVQNESLSTDLDGSGYIDANDLLLDARWTDGRDTDGNGFVDDFFGWNFRRSNEVFAPNAPLDTSGHGTHVAGIIGAVGNNGIGVAGLNWHSSLMSLKFLDENNRGDLASAIASINYANMMRRDFNTNVRVINASWGVVGGENSLLSSAVADAGSNGILVVAAAGNGNILGQGFDLDDTPFFPASLPLENVIAVAASDSSDRLASFSNYGNATVDIAAPGVGVRSTLPGARYGEANGTSMAAPFVSGVAALVWSRFPTASVAEVRAAILDNGDTLFDLDSRVVSSARLSAHGAITSNRFAPSAGIVSVSDVTIAGATEHEVRVVFKDPNRIDLASVGDGDLMVKRQWGTAEELGAILIADSVRSLEEGRRVEATYRIAPPGGSWDALDFGNYQIFTVPGEVLSAAGLSIPEINLDAFEVRIDDPHLLYVSQNRDSLESGSLRSAIDNANADPGNAYTIVLESGSYSIDLEQVADPNLLFESGAGVSCGPSGLHAGWSQAETGDFDIYGNITIVGDSKSSTTIDGNLLDRVFKVHEAATLQLERLTVRRGLAPNGQGGSGILSRGNLILSQVDLIDNGGIDAAMTSRGGGIAAWSGTVSVEESRIAFNEADFGGGVFLCGTAQASIVRSTIDGNQGGGVLSYSASDSNIETSTIAGNFDSAVAMVSRDYSGGTASSTEPRISSDGSKVIFLSQDPSLVAGDSNGFADVFQFDVATGRVSRLSQSTDGQEANAPSSALTTSAKGEVTVFLSEASNLVANDSNRSSDLFSHQGGVTTLVSFPSGPNREVRGQPAVSEGTRYIAFQQFLSNEWRTYFLDTDTHNYLQVPSTLESEPIDFSWLSELSMSGDGRYLAIASNRSLTDIGELTDILVYDRVGGVLSRPIPEAVRNGSFFAPSFDETGSKLAFASDDSRLIQNDGNNATDIFTLDLSTDNISRVSVGDSGQDANGPSFDPEISDDGRYVAFSSLAFNLVDGDSNGVSDIFVRDLVRGTTELVSAPTSGVPANGGSWKPSISGDGRFVVFESSATNLAPFHPNHVRAVETDMRQIYLADRLTGSITEVSAFSAVAEVALRNSTLVSNSGAYTVIGNISTQSTLFAGNSVVADLGRDVVSSGNNLYSSKVETVETGPNDIQSPNAQSTLGPFRSFNSLPPSYEPLDGSLAIDGGVATNGDTDQWGRVREQVDIGALEAVAATAGGNVFVDRDGDTRQGLSEPSLGQIRLYVDGNNDGIHQIQELNSDSIAEIDDELELTVGDFLLQDIAPGNHVVRAIVPEGWQASTPEVQRVSIADIQPNSASREAVISPSASSVAFVSAASNLVAGDGPDESLFIFSGSGIIKVPTSGANLKPMGFFGESEELLLFREDSGVYYFDRETAELRLLSRSNAGMPANAHSNDADASMDGRWVVFSSFANNLVPGDTDNNSDIFLFDSVAQEIWSVTQLASGAQGNADSENPTISDDGQWIVFDSDASDLVADDENSLRDVFVYNRLSNSIFRINLAANGDEANAFTYPPAISKNGHFVVFQSLASNLVEQDQNSTSDIFVYNLESRQLEKLDIGLTTSVGNRNLRTNISADGQYITFEAAQRLIDGTSNELAVFVYDRFVSNAGIDNQLALVSTTLEDGSGFEMTPHPRLSNDGRSLVFQTAHPNLINGDTNSVQDVFIASNPFEANSRAVELSVGQRLDSLQFGLEPNPGTISGTVYQDSNLDHVFGFGDSSLPDWTVYIDNNNNARLDVGEFHAQTNANGDYQFTDLPSYRDYILRVDHRNGWRVTSPEGGARVSILAGGEVRGLDFGAIPDTTSGQTRNGVVEGKVFRDANSDGIWQADEIGIGNVDVYLDLNGNSQREFDEPRISTSTQGSYRFENLPGTEYVARLSTPEGLAVSSPIGNRFSSETLAIATGSTLLSSPQDVVFADIDGVNGKDIVAVLGPRNEITVQLNQGNATFAQARTFPVSPAGISPLAVAAGEFDAIHGADIAVANAGNRTVSVFTGFSNGLFASTAVLTLAGSPVQIVAEDVDQDGDTDLLVLVNQVLNGAVQIFSNDGLGGFTPAALVETQGVVAVDMAVGGINLKGEEKLQLAVSHTGPPVKNPGPGSISVLRQGENSTFSLQFTMAVPPLPYSLDFGDLNSDTVDDLAVVSSTTNSASIFRGDSGGMFAEIGTKLFLGSGPVQIQLADVEGDGDIDVLSSNIESKSISILRNRGLGSPIEFDFEPGESLGVAQLSTGARFVFDAADFDESGTIDIALVSSLSNSLTLLSNDIVEGGRRFSFESNQAVSSQDFGLRELRIAPIIDPPTIPAMVLEDSSPIAIALTGIFSGYSTDAEVIIEVTSSAPDVLQPSVEYEVGSSQAVLRLTAAKDANGSDVEIVLMVRNAGLDGIFHTADDGIADPMNYSVDVIAVNDPPSFRLAGDQAATIGSGLRELLAYAIDFKTGGGQDEDAQTISEYIVSNDFPELFIAQPRIDNQGVLRYQPGLAAIGISTVTVRGRDTGGNENGGDDRSAEQTFKILVTDLADGLVDFGDAPLASQSSFTSSYPTVIADNGARHRLSDLYLGTSVDAEPNGTPTEMADGDLSDIDDENGVQFIANPVADEELPQLGAVAVSSSQAAKLDAWIDWNQDGDWLDSGEQILASAHLESGENLLSFTVPAGALPGRTYARFRVSSAGGLSVSGEAADGEVEDYVVDVIDSGGAYELSLRTDALGSHEVRTNGAQVQIRVDDRTLLSMPAESLSAISLQSLSGEPRYRIESNAISFDSRFSFNDSEDALSLVTEGSLDALVTIPLVDGLDRVSFVGAGSQTLYLGSSSLSHLNSQLIVTLGSGDTIESTEQWQLVARNVFGRGTEHVFLHDGLRVSVSQDAQWQNPFVQFDVVADGTVSPLDALVIINFLNSEQSTLPEFRPGEPFQPFLDVSGDGIVSPLDVLLVINQLNSSGGEGECYEAKEVFDFVESERQRRRSQLLDQVLLQLLDSQTFL